MEQGRDRTPFQESQQHKLTRENAFSLDNIADSDIYARPVQHRKSAPSHPAPPDFHKSMPNVLQYGHSQSGAEDLHRKSLPDIQNDYKNRYAQYANVHHETDRKLM